MQPRIAIPLFVALMGTFASGSARADIPSCRPSRATLLSPNDGASFEGNPARVAVAVEVGRGESPEGVEVLVDGKAVASKAITQNGEYAFSIEVEPGTRKLEARVRDACAGRVGSRPISITVKAPTPNKAAEEPSPEPTAAEHEASSVKATRHAPKADAEPAAKDGGCAVSRIPDRTVLGFSAFSLALLGAWRLRRARESDRT